MLNEYWSTALKQGLHMTTALQSHSAVLCYLQPQCPHALNVKPWSLTTRSQYMG